MSIARPLLTTADHAKNHSKSNRANRPAVRFGQRRHFAPHQPGDNKPHIDSNLRITNFHMR